jgi:alpha-glucosidase
MSAYTSGNERLHMAYTFDYLGGAFSAAHFKKSIECTEQMAPDGWVSLAFSNHDVVRHVSRWSPRANQEALTRQACMLLLSMRGSVCLYQGEELGLPEAELAFEDLADPYGIEFWPEFKGRDGCRTPMVWQAAAHLGGFSTSPRSWLPVPNNHLLRAVDQQLANPDSVLLFYRAMIGFRKEHPALIKGEIEVLDTPEPVLAFIRRHAAEHLLCVFNMSEGDAEFTLPAGMMVGDVGAPGRVPAPEAGSVSLPPFTAYIGAIA